MTHLKKVIAEELSQLKARELEMLSDKMVDVVALSLTRKDNELHQGVLNKLLDELWDMVIEEQRRKMQELKNEEERFSI